MRTAVVTALTTAVLLSGCTFRDRGLPAVTVTAVPTDAAAACERFHDALPRDLGDELPRRDTAPEDLHVAAYGEPPIVIRCGAPPTTTYEPGEQLIDIDGVDWHAEERGDVVVWSLPRAFVNVEVTIPKGWTGDRLAHLGDAVRAMS